LLDLPVPAILSKSIRTNFIMAHLIEPIDFLKPNLDGRLTHYYEWANAGYFDCRKAGSTMHKADRVLKAIYYGYGKKGEIFVRLDPTVGANFLALKIVLELTAPQGLKITFENGKVTSSSKLDFLECGFGTIFEVGFASPEIKGNDSSLKIRIYDGQAEIEKWPPVDMIPIRPDIAEKMFWIV
jgi:hypothetical protein